MAARLAAETHRINLIMEGTTVLQFQKSMLKTHSSKGSSGLIGSTTPSRM